MNIKPIQPLVPQEIKSVEKKNNIYDLDLECILHQGTRETPKNQVTKGNACSNTCVSCEYTCGNCVSYDRRCTGAGKV